MSRWVNRIETLKRALADLQKGKFVLIYDNEKREGETDLVIASQFATWESIKQLRKDGGGLIFLMISHEIADQFQLPFLADVFSETSRTYPVFNALIPNDIPYDTKSSFSLAVNHRKTFTGITDIDRSMTMKKFADLIQHTEKMDSTAAMKAFGVEFRSPGHVPICVASKNLLDERSGHTELVIALLQMAVLLPAGSGCEMMGENGKALSKKEAIAYAQQHDLVFIEGKEIIKAWKLWSK